MVTVLGKCNVPDKVYDNKYFESIVETNEESILSRTGIKERRILEKGATSDLATNAALDLLEKQIDCIIVATVTPDMFRATDYPSFKKELVQLMPGHSILKQLVQDSFSLFKQVVHL